MSSGADVVLARWLGSSPRTPAKGVPFVWHFQLGTFGPTTISAPITTGARGQAKRKPENMALSRTKPDDRQASVGWY